MNLDIYFLLFIFFGKREVTSKTAEDESQHRHPWKQQGPLDRQGERTQLRVNTRRRPGYKAVISFSLKCLKVGNGPGVRTDWAPPRPRQAERPAALRPHPRWPGRPSTWDGETAKTHMCFLPRHVPLGAAALPPTPSCAPRPPPTTESETFQPAEPEAGVLSECLPPTPGPAA